MNPAEPPRPNRRPALDVKSAILRQCHTIAVVGLSSKPHRPSRGVAEYMQSAGYRIIPINPNETSVLGETAYARLEDVPVPVDLVNIFRRSDSVPEIVRSAIAIGARAVWMQEGVVHHEAAEAARQAGLLVVMDACVMKEHVARYRTNRP